MSRGCIEKLTLVGLLIADALLKKMIPYETVASECLPDQDFLIIIRLEPEFHTFGDNGFVQIYGALRM